MKPSLFIFGFGYTAEFLAPKLSPLGFDVAGTARKANPSVYNLINFSEADIKRHLSKATHILVSIPPLETIGDVVLAYYAEHIKHYSSQIQWIGYLSSTAVYGNHNGQWVDESSLCNPLSTSGILRLQAEQSWQLLAEKHHLPIHLFRLAGIYGPRRNALERIAAGKKYSIYKEGQVFSRVYIEDIVSVIIASIQSPNPLSIYNVADDEPAPSHVVDAYAAYLLNKPPLPLMPFMEATLSAMEKDFYSNNRRVHNKKIKQELLVQLNYPTYRQGLQKLYDTGDYGC